MDEITRRGVLAQTAGIGLASTLARSEAAAQDVKGNPSRTDRDRVIACGMTEAEADCWEVVANAAGKFFELPELHPMDKQEVATAIHVIQHKLLSRPVYRRYKEMTKADAKSG